MKEERRKKRGKRKAANNPYPAFARQEEEGLLGSPRLKKIRREGGWGRAFHGPLFP